MTKYFENVKKNFGFGCMRFPNEGRRSEYCRMQAHGVDDLQTRESRADPRYKKLERLKENGLAGDIVLSGAEVSAIDERLDTIRMSAVFGGSGAAKR